LRDQRKLKLTNHPKYISKYIDRKTTVLLKNKFHKILFSKIREKFKIDKNFAEFLEINKATLSAWRLKKNRIPIYVLEKMCKVLDLKFNEASRNIEKTDREIAEII